MQLVTFQTRAVRFNPKPPTTRVPTKLQHVHSMPCGHVLADVACVEANLSRPAHRGKDTIIEALYIRPSVIGAVQTRAA